EERRPSSGVRRLRVCCLRNLVDADAPEGDRVTMILDPDASFTRPRIPRMILELALRDQPVPLVAPELVRDNLDAIEPVLDMTAIHDNAGRVPGPGRPRRITQRRLQIVIRGGPLRGLQRLWVAAVIDDLVLGCDHPHLRV